jgi:hypothetical protein
MSRSIRSLLAAMMLSFSTLTLVSTTLAPLVHAEDVDCSQDENKGKDECKK